MRTETKTYFSFTELSEDQKKHVIEKYPEEFSPYDDWYECEIDAIKDALQMVGFYDVNVSFSGFWSQGDGAQFTGKYSYEKGALKRIKKEFPQWEELHTFAKELQKLERKYFYSISFKISHSGHYHHENCTSFDFEDSRSNYGWVSDSFEEEEWKQACRSFMQDIYATLEKEYCYLTSEEYILENDDLFNHVEFTENHLS